MGYLFGIDLPGIIAYVESERGVDQRLGPLVVALDDLGEALRRAQPVHGSQAAGSIRVQLEGAAPAARTDVSPTKVGNALLTACCSDHVVT